MEAKNRKTGETQKDIFDGVMICTGHHANAYIPSFPGDDEFQVFCTIYSRIRVWQCFESCHVVCV